MDNIYIPIVPQQPAPESLQAYEHARAQYETGLQQYLASQNAEALLTLTGVFHELKESEDQACLHLVMYSLMLACEAKLRLGQLNTCTTLCTFLIGKAAGVDTLRTVLARLLHIRQEAYAAQGRQPVLMFGGRPGQGQNEQAPAVHMVNNVLAHMDEVNEQLAEVADRAPEGPRDAALLAAAEGVPVLPQGALQGAPAPVAPANVQYRVARVDRNRVHVPMVWVPLHQLQRMQQAPGGLPVDDGESSDVEDSDLFVPPVAKAGAVW